MLSLARESDQAEALPLPTFPRLHQPDGLQSPSLTSGQAQGIAAFEIKFLISEEIARQVESWAAEHLERDAFSSLDKGGSYETTTLYLDTPGLDVFYRTSGFRGRKFRLRRYGEEARIYLERKSRRGDRVKKRRSDIPQADLSIFQYDGAAVDWPGIWFRDRVAARSLSPVCRITYDRTAFMQHSTDGPIRLTLDRNIRGLPSQDWELPPVHDGHQITPGQVICEFKFRNALPVPFKDLIAALQLRPGSISKYRRVMSAAGIANEGLGGND